MFEFVKHDPLVLLESTQDVHKAPVLPRYSPHSIYKALAQLQSDPLFRSMSEQFESLLFMSGNMVIAPSPQTGPVPDHDCNNTKCPLVVHIQLYHVVHGGNYIITGVNF
eukprot:m.245730 g.245730  ORF g.245730 m.245730 type:complete len:109 (+) comp33838_c6_seq4:699-1025(+)